MTKKSVPLSLVLTLCEPWVFASRLLSCFMEEEGITRITSRYKPTVLDQGVKKLFLPSTSGTPIITAVTKESREHIISSCCCYPLPSWSLFSNPIMCVCGCGAVLEVTDFPDSTNRVSKSSCGQEVENSPPKPHSPMGRWSCMGVSDPTAAASL